MIDVQLSSARESPVDKIREPSAMKTFLIAGVGTALEYYDFLIYGLAAALVFNTMFFPGADPLLGTMYAFAAFGTGFAARPLGGIVIGHFGDKIGRRKMLVLTLIVMGVSTFLIGCLPGYDTIGIAAPILLVVLRLIQGFAAGGEWGGAALFGIESAPAGRRGFWGSFTSMGIGLGTLLGIGAFAIVSIAFGDDLSFAWRIPFWIGGVLVILGLIARLSMPEQEAIDEGPNDDKRLPLVQAFRRSPRVILLGVGVSYGYNTLAYIGFTFFLTYLKQLGYGFTESLVAQLLYAAVLLASAPMFALLSDAIGRKKVMVLGAILTSAYLFAFFPMVGTGNITIVVLSFAIIGALTGITQGPIPAFLGEQFPARMRYSGISTSYQLGAAVGGGTAAFIATALLIAFDSNPLSVAIYGLFAMAVLAGCSLGLRETSKLTNAELNAEIRK